MLSIWKLSRPSRPRATRKREAELAEDARDLALRLDQRVQRTRGKQQSRERDVARSRARRTSSAISVSRERRVAISVSSCSRMGLASAPTLVGPHLEAGRCRPEALSAFAAEDELDFVELGRSSAFETAASARLRSSSSWAEKDSRSTAISAPLPGPCDLGDAGKRGRIANRDVGQDLAIELDARRLQPADQLGVGQAILTSGCVEPDDPQSETGACAACGRHRRTPWREERFTRWLDQLSVYRADPRPRSAAARRLCAVTPRLTRDMCLPF